MATDHNFRIKNGLEVGGQLIVTSSGQLAVAAVSSQLQFLDNVKAKFGNGSDLQIWHESSTSNSYISEGGAGNLYISANNLRLTNYGITESYLQADANGAVTLYYDNSAKLATTSSGIDVTGSITASSTIASNNITITDDLPKITFTDTDTSTSASISSNSSHLTYTTPTAARDHIFKQDTTERMRLTDVGLGIGTSSPAKNLHVAGDARMSDGNGLIDFNPGYVPINATHSSGYAHIQINGMQFGGNTTSTDEGYMKPADNSRKLAVDSNGFRFYIGGITSSDELIRFDSAGKVGIGTTSPGQLLTVEGGAEAIGLNLTGSGSRLTIGSDGTYNYFRAKSGNQFKFTTTGGSDLLLNNSGVLTLSAGTSNRTVQLQDDGLYISRTTDGAYTSKVVSDTNTNNLAVYARSYINFYHNAAKRFSFRETGELGINEASPNYTIHATKDMASSPSNIIYLEMSGTNANGGGGAIRFDTSASNTTETAYWAGIEGIRSGTSDGSNELKFYTASATTNGGAPSVKMTIDKDGNIAIGNSVDASTKLRVTGSTTDSSADALKVEDSSGNDLLRVVNDGRVLIGDNYLYVSSSGGAFFDGSIKARGGINNDQGDLTLSDNVNVTGQLQVYNGSSANRIRLYTETGTAQIADTFSDTTTQKSYIYFDAGSGSNDPGYIMHETSDSETNEGVLHLVPSDDNDASDYVSIHGTNDADCLRLRTNGKIETTGSYQLTLLSGSGDVLVDDGLTVSNNLTVTGDLVVNGSTTTFNTATLDVEDKNITLNYGSGDTSATANGAGITIQDAVDASTDATILWDATNDEFDFSHKINVNGHILGSGVISLTGTSGSTLYGLQLTRSGSGTATPDLWGNNGTLVLGTSSTDEAIAMSGQDVITHGKLTMNQKGFAVSDAYYAWRRTYSVSNSSTKEILDRDGNSLNTAGVYTFSAHIPGTSVNGGTRAVFWNVDGTWRYNVTSQSGNSSNHPEFIIDATSNKPTIRFDHTSTYTVHVYHEWMRLNEESGGSDNSQAVVGADGYMSSVNGVLRYEPDGISDTGIDQWDEGYTIWHSNNAQQFTTTLKNKLDGIESNATADQTAADIRGLGFFDTSNDGSGSGLDADTVDGIQGASFLRSDAGDTSSATYYFSRTSTTPVFDIGGHAGASSYNYFLRAGNDTYSTTAVHFVNGSTRTADHGANAYVIRNDNGTFVLGRTSQSTKIYGSGDLTYNDNEVWHAGNDGPGSGLDADTLDGINSGSFLRSDANDVFTAGTLAISGSGSSSDLVLGTYSSTNQGILYLTGSTANKQSVIKTTNGNLHIDSNAGNNTYINFYTGSGTYFGTGAGGIAAVMGSDGDLWKGSSDNSGNKYWHAGNDGGGSGLDADTVDGIQANSFLRSDADDTYTGNLTVTGNINQTGSLTATTKSFDIKHPTKEGMRLHHGVLEGPEHAVYIRGKSNSYIIELPDYWEGLVHEDTITVQLTPIGGQNDMWIENIEDNKVYINCEKEMKQYFYFIQAERKDIERFEVEYGNSI